jgi:hypothetical protein
MSCDCCHQQEHQGYHHLFHNLHFFMG